MAFGLVTREVLLHCVAEQRRFAQQGRHRTLAQIMISRQVITADVYRQVVERIRQRVQQLQQHQAAPPGQIPPPPPDITSSGRYMGIDRSQFKQKASDVLPAHMNAPVPSPGTPGWNEAPPPSDEEIREAARSWDDVSSSVEVSYEVIADSAPDAPVVSPQAARERKDSGIRKTLGVPEEAAEFEFGPYRILGEVASGGMGIIYRARASDTGNIYALKALINVDNASDKQLRRFIQEAQSAMRLDHPGIVRIHDLGIYENIPYFTMDLVDGEDLHHHLKHKSLQPGDLLQIFTKVCEAVDYAHEHGVIHRDLKPANIIVRNGDRFPVLTDFGLAKNLDSSFKLTAEGAMVGTPLFLSPEQVSGKAQDVDRRCDVYGLGVMLYQMLTGKLPFIGRNPYEVYKKVLEEDATPPTQLNPQVSPELEKICLMALAKDREERYATALAMGEDIKRFTRGEPVQGKLPTPASVAKAKNDAPKKRSRRLGERKAGGAGRPPPPADAASKATLVLIAAAIVVIVVALSYIVYVVVAG